MRFNEVAERFFPGELAPLSDCLISDFPNAPGLAGTRVGMVLKRFQPGSPLAEAHNRILELGRVGIEDGVIVFCEEHQNASYWGIRAQDCSLEDPPVLRCENEEPIEWRYDFECLDDFLIVFCLWQALNGAWPYYAIGSQSDCAAIAEGLWRWEAIDVSGNASGLQFLGRGSEVIAATAGDEFFLATRSDAVRCRLIETVPALRWLHDR